MDPRDEISSLKGIGEKNTALFHKVGVFSLMDLVRYYPASYVKYPKIKNTTELTGDEKAALLLEVKTEATSMYVRRMSVLSFTASDEKGSVKVVFFNAPFMKKAIKPGMRRVFYGTIKVKGSSYEMIHPKMFKTEDYEELGNTLVPVYPLTKGLSENMVTKAVKQAFISLPEIKDYLSDEDREELGLIPLRDSLYGMHFPADDSQYIKARERVVFDEFLHFIRSLRRIRQENSVASNDFHMIESAEAVRLMESLPFRLTLSQKKAYEDIVSDISSEHAMNRLIEGDVGSGKTLVAVLAMLTAVKNGYQAAIMAPTEVLAAQHMNKISELLKAFDVRCTLLTGALSEKDKKEARKTIAEGKTDIIIGTHALITDLVEYKNLALVVTDEQHRFGVNQRKTLSEKAGGRNPHVLVMSATPIPRTLAIILYGDLDITVMEDRPAERMPVKNAVVGKEYRSRAYNFIKKEVKAGHQAYIICPLVEAAEDGGGNGENVTDYSEMLRGLWKDEVRVGMLHGRMKNNEKNDIMDRFASGDVDVLVSTTVVEVGVDVPNATVMMIEDAGRFGLAQLHQLRGRIGRGDQQSYCIFVDTSGKEETTKRLGILKDTNDGFEIASKDLKLRGPGDVFGIRQSGEMGFRTADIYTDAGSLKKASEYAATHPDDDTDGDINVTL